jgi:transaldolase
MSEPLRQLADEGVAIWLDDMSRQRLVSGNLKALVRDKHVVGVTTNPTILNIQMARKKPMMWDSTTNSDADRGARSP